MAGAWACAVAGIQMTPPEVADVPPNSSLFSTIVVCALGRGHHGRGEYGGPGADYQYVCLCVHRSASGT